MKTDNTNNKGENDYLPSLYSKESSVTRICVFDTDLVTASNTKSHSKCGQNTTTHHTTYEKYLSIENSSNGPNATVRKMFDRKKSSALRNTTLEEICEN